MVNGAGRRRNGRRRRVIDPSTAQYFTIDSRAPRRRFHDTQAKLKVGASVRVLYAAAYAHKTRAESDTDPTQARNIIITR